MTSLMGVDSFVVLMAVGMMVFFLLVALAKSVVATVLFRLIMRKLHKVRPRFVPAVLVLFVFQAGLLLAIGGKFVTGNWLFGHVPGYELSRELDRVYRVLTSHTALWQIGQYAVMALLLAFMAQRAHKRALRHGMA